MSIVRSKGRRFYALKSGVELNPWCDCCRYEIGLEKLLAAETDVNAMKADLIELQPKLIETGNEVKQTLIVVNSETLEAEKKRTVVQGEEAIANEKAAAAKLIKVSMI